MLVFTSNNDEKKNKTEKNKKSFKKSVALGMTYSQPLPMPMRSDGMPDWEAPDFGSFVSYLLDKGPLKGKVVILKRLPNGMYVIAADENHVKDDDNRKKDKSKLRKEDIREDNALDDGGDNYGTSMGKSRRSQEMFRRKILKSLYKSEEKPPIGGNAIMGPDLHEQRRIAIERGNHEHARRLTAEITRQERIAAQRNKRPPGVSPEAWASRRDPLKKWR